MPLSWTLCNDQNAICISPQNVTGKKKNMKEYVRTIIIVRNINERRI